MRTPSSRTSHAPSRAPLRQSGGGHRHIPDAAFGCRRAGCVERGVVPEDLYLQCGELRPGVDAELVGERPGDPAVGRQRVGLPPGPVQRGDQQPPQPLAERVDRDE